MTQHVIDADKVRRKAIEIVKSAADMPEREFFAAVALAVGQMFVTMHPDKIDVYTKWFAEAVKAAVYASQERSETATEMAPDKVIIVLDSTKSK